MNGYPIHVEMGWRRKLTSYFIFTDYFNWFELFWETSTSVSGIHWVYLIRMRLSIFLGFANIKYAFFLRYSKVLRMSKSKHKYGLCKWQIIICYNKCQVFVHVKETITFPFYLFLQFIFNPDFFSGEMIKF